MADGLRLQMRTVVYRRYSHTVGPDEIRPHIPQLRPGFVRKSVEISQDLYGNGLRAEITDEEVFGEATGSVSSQSPSPPEPPADEPERKINFREFL